MASDITWTNETRKLSQLIPWEHNPRLTRTDQAERMVDSLDIFGQVQTIAVGPDDEIYDGHQRKFVWSAAQEFGPDYEVDVRVSSRTLTERERQQLVVYLHKGAAGEWDFDALANGFDVGDLLEWGFEEVELGLAGFDLGNGPEDPGPQIDKAAELQEKWQVERGQVWQIGRHRVMCGDSTAAEDVGELVGGEIVALCVTSPPYFVGKEYEQQRTESEIVKFIDSAGSIISSVVCPSRRIVINCATTPWSHIGGEIDYRLNLDWWQAAFRKTGWLTRSVRIWSKHGGLVHNAPNADIVDMHWEFLAAFYKPKEKYRGQNRVGEDWATSGIWDGIHGAIQDYHSAPYPVVIPERFILLYTDESESVFEPFLGSGTTLVACEQTGRIGYGMEIEPKYCAVTLERLAGMGLEPELVE